MDDTDPIRDFVLRRIFALLAAIAVMVKLFIVMTQRVLTGMILKIKVYT